MVDLCVILLHAKGLILDAHIFFGFIFYFGHIFEKTCSCYSFAQSLHTLTTGMNGIVLAIYL